MFDRVGAAADDAQTHEAILEEAAVATDLIGPNLWSLANCAEPRPAKNDQY